jgi:hypothetical protein
MKKENVMVLEVNKYMFEGPITTNDHDGWLPAAQLKHPQSVCLP